MTTLNQGGGDMTTLNECVARLLGVGPKGHHPASAIIGVRTGSHTAVEAAGWAVLPDPASPGVPMSRELLLDLASVTKVAATTTMMMRLHAAGLIDLEARAARYLPDLMSDDHRDITLAQLLTHTAGLEPWEPLYFDAHTREQATARAARVPLATRPGTARRYSDLGFILAGAIIECVTAQPLQAAYRELVADPLGLSSRFGPVPAKLAAAAADSDIYEFGMIRTGTPYPVPFSPTRYGGWRHGLVHGQVADGNAAHALDGVSGHAGLFSTVGDLLTLGAALRGGEFVPAAVLRRFSEPSAQDAGQAVGFQRRILRLGSERLTLLCHSGFTGTWFGFALEGELVIAGGAMRLHGNTEWASSSPQSQPEPGHPETRPDVPDLLPGGVLPRIADTGEIVPAIVAGAAAVSGVDDFFYGV